MRTLALFLGLLLHAPLSVLADDSAKTSPATRDANGFLVHSIASPYQSGETKIKVLLPDDMEPGKRYPVLYVLPVEPGEGVRWGDGLLEVKNRGLHNRHCVICVLPTFSHMPWYADHPTDAGIRQESHLLNVVLPTVDRSYPTLARRDGRMLVGFSKSGFGAITLLLRHPDVFGKAAAWDAPLMMQRPDKYGMAEIFATQENFEKYRIARLLKQRGPELGENRLIHFGYDNFRDHHQAAHQLMHDLKIAHTYHDGPRRTHAWQSGWLPEAVDMLFFPVLTRGSIQSASRNLNTDAF